MKILRQCKPSGKAFTLLEMTVVLMVLIALIKIGLDFSTKLNQWKLGRTASETLRTVYSAQRMFLADNPTRAVSSILATDIIPYLPNNAIALPTVTSLTGTSLSITVNVSPPVISDGVGGVYDPSGNPQDNLWDVGQ